MTILSILKRVLHRFPVVTGTRGAVAVEYIVVTVMVSLIGAAAIYAVGAPLMARFRFMQMLIMLPVP